MTICSNVSLHWLIHGLRPSRCVMQAICSRHAQQCRREQVRIMFETCNRLVQKICDLMSLIHMRHPFRPPPLLTMPSLPHHPHAFEAPPGSYMTPAGGSKLNRAPSTKKASSTPRNRGVDCVAYGYHKRGLTSWTLLNPPCLYLNPY